MYKVFVENTPIYFQKNSLLESNVPEKFLPSLSLADFDTFVYEIKLLNSKGRVFLNGPDPIHKIKDFFKHFQWIEAAGGIVKNTKTDALLFILRNGVWDIPKGKIELGETPKEAAIREINEECGMNNLKIESALAPTYHIYFAYGKHWIKKTYWYTLSSPQKEVVPQVEEGISEIKWFQENQLETIKKNTYSSILDVIKGYLENIK